MSSTPVTVSQSLTTLVGEKGCDPFPMIDNAWDVFSGKGIRTVFLSIGNSKSVAADLDMAESLGCPVHAVPLSSKEAEEWKEVTQILKERKREGASFSFTEGAESKWILPKNVRVLPALPWWYSGEIDVSGGSVKTSGIMGTLTSMCEAMKMKDNAVRIDILKIDTLASALGLEKSVLAATLDAGFRPATLIVNWSVKPDADLSTTLAAGHLQNCGYRLISKLDNKFLYYFTDNDMYQICSWEDRSCANPMCNAIAASLDDSLKAKSV